MCQFEGQARAKALCIKRHEGSFCPRAASRARSRWHTGRGRVLASALAWAGFPLSSAPPCSLGTLYFDHHGQAVSDCDTMFHGQRANGQTPKIRANPSLFSSRQLASHPSPGESINRGHTWHPGVPSPAHLGLWATHTKGWPLCSDGDQESGWARAVSKQGRSRHGVTPDSPQTLAW